MSQPMIQAEGLSKVYRIGARETLPDTAFGALKRIVRSPLRNLKALRQLDPSKLSPENEGGYFWALRDISFKVDEGEVVGIIGRNGAGKSTLLKIFSRITSPSFGQAILNGRVSSLLEVGTGFHPDLTGRENIYMNGTILGMRKREIDKKFGEIVDFSAVEAFLDTPIKRYSSGMQVRLAFAVAAHLEPEILIIDEVLAVGDSEFQKKCLGKMKDVASSGRTVLFVSHNMHAVRSLTQKVALLDAGQLVCFDETDQAIRTYASSSTDENDQQHSLEVYRNENYGDTTSWFRGIGLCDDSTTTNSIPTVESGSPITLRIRIETTAVVETACLNLSLTRDGETIILTAFTGDQNVQLRFDPGLHTIDCNLGRLALAPGRYFVSAVLRPSIYTLSLDAVADVPVFDVKLPTLDQAEMPWPQRPWGALHLKDVNWKVSKVARWD